MANLSIPGQVLLDIIKFILEKNLINVENVEKPLNRDHILVHISEFILEANHINAWNVEKPFIRAQVSVYISKFTVASGFSQI